MTTEEIKKIILEELQALLDEKKGKKRVSKKKGGKKDACYHKVKARYDVWPSAYASGALTKCRKVGAANWGNKSKKNESLNEEVSEEEMTDAEIKQLRKITGQLKNSAKMHKDQAEDIEGIISEDQLEEAEYRGRKVKLNKPMRGDVKKFKVFVKDPKTGNVKKVNFGDPNMRIKKSNPKRRKSFRARHNCDNPGPKTKARYWSCRKW